MAISAHEHDLRLLEEQTAIARWRYADVVFTAADTDTAIAHDFRGIDPEEVRWVTLAVEGPAYVYRAARGTRTAFSVDQIFLRASAPCAARLLLIVEQPL